jgi:hypothetical protein
MTGTVACRASSSTVSCANVRTASASTYWLMTRAKSPTVLAHAQPTSLPWRKIALPPRCAIAASKLTRVRSEGFSNNRPSVLPASSGDRHPLSSPFRATARSSKSRSRRRDVEQIDEIRVIAHLQRRRRAHHGGHGDHGE